MEYTSPGHTPLCFLALVTSLAYIMTLSVALTSGQQHEARHGRHNSYRKYKNYDYEDSTAFRQPEFVNSESNVTVVEGSMATLPCTIRHLGTREVAWKRMGEKHFLTVGAFTWVKEYNIQVEQRREEGQMTSMSLIIKSVKQSDEGTYECQVTDKVPIRSYVYLTVKPRANPKPAIMIDGQEFVDRNERIRLTCNATGGGNIPEDIDWFKDGTKLDSRNTKHPNVVITKYRSLEEQALISELTIEHTDTDDTGTYICRSSDREIASRKVTVLVAADTTNVKRAPHDPQADPYKDKENGSSRCQVLVPLLLCLLTTSFL
ncbi:kin of IRRE-like protein 1 isoform X3 [Physella acuta]|uniref:kin of IRRE-like protein 1 isoform X3 n=1 Tax=Physella acuta TaxID=109671 RepID=UPI0027DE3C40|nr:kin of IRRE-like protein 1 isoform X3 [Physella acuta]